MKTACLHKNLYRDVYASIIHKLSIGENSPNVYQLTHGQAMRSVHTMEDYLTTHRNEVLTLDNVGEPWKHVNQSQKYHLYEMSGVVQWIKTESGLVAA